MNNVEERREETANPPPHNPETRIGYMPPTTATRKLADKILEAVLTVAKEKNIDLSVIYNTLDGLDLFIIDRYRLPVTDAIMKILEQNQDLFNGWREALTMVRLEIRHKLSADSDKTILGKILKIINPLT